MQQTVSASSASSLSLAVARARSVQPTWGTGWSVAIASGPDVFTTRLASVEQVFALAEELDALGYGPVFEPSHSHFTFRREQRPA